MSKAKDFELLAEQYKQMGATLLKLYKVFINKDFPKGFFAAKGSIEDLKRYVDNEGYLNSQINHWFNQNIYQFHKTVLAYHDRKMDNIIFIIGPDQAPEDVFIHKALEIKQ